MSNMNFTCDVCGREILGCNIINGMKFCAKCYQETFGANKDWQLLDKDKEIADLKAKLAEEAKKMNCQHIEHKSQENAQNSIINELKEIEKLKADNQRLKMEVSYEKEHKEKLYKYSEELRRQIKQLKAVNKKLILRQIKKE